MDAEAEAYFDWVKRIPGFLGVKISQVVWDTDYRSRFSSKNLMALYLTDRLSGSRGFGRVQASTLEATLSRFNSWLTNRGAGGPNPVLSTLAYPNFFTTVRRVDRDKKSAAEQELSATRDTHSLGTYS